jgi:hypothetical protein
VSASGEEENERKKKDEPGHERRCESPATEPSDRGLAVLLLEAGPKRRQGKLGWGRGDVAKREKSTGKVELGCRGGQIEGLVELVRSHDAMPCGKPRGGDIGPGVG